MKSKVKVFVLGAVLLLLVVLGVYCFTLHEEQDASFKVMDEMGGKKNWIPKAEGLTQYEYSYFNGSYTTHQYRWVVDFEMTQGAVHKLVFTSENSDKSIEVECNGEKHIRKEVVFDKLEPLEEIKVTAYFDEGTRGTVTWESYGRFYGYQKILMFLRGE